MSCWRRAPRALGLWLALLAALVSGAAPYAARAAFTTTAVVTAPSVPTGSAPLAGRIIAVDPGHGGKDPGASANGLDERQVTLGVGLDLRQLLLDNGATVVMTRTSDVTVGAPDDPHDGLQVRSDMANQNGANLFVSIHANAAPGPAPSGVTTYFGQACGYVSSALRSPILISRSYRLASHVESQVAQATGAVNDGVDAADYWVLGNTRMPSILVETGFVTDPAEAERLALPAYQQKIARAILAGVVDFFAAGEDQMSLPPAPATANKAHDDATFQEDVTVPDGAAETPGATFTKTWRIRNTGCASWSGGYRLAFRGGDHMGGPDSVPVGVVDPGGSANVSVPLVAPSPPNAMGYWQMQDPSGKPFGDKMWVRIGKTAAGVAARVATGPPPTARSAPTTDTANATYFAETGHNVAFAFKRYFDTQGGLDRFGFPRTEELVENGMRVQYFQRARMEFHPDRVGTPEQVQLSLIGDWVTAGRGPFPSSPPFKTAVQHAYFPQTGYAVSFGFLRYYDAHGGAAAFGYPISNEVVEPDARGTMRTVQYFQRARFEYHPEFAGTRYEVELGLLGDEYLRLRGWLP